MKIYNGKIKKKVYLETANKIKKCIFNILIKTEKALGAGIGFFCYIKI